MATTFDQMLGTGFGPMVLKGGDRVDSVCSTAITETAYLPRGLSFVDHEAVEHQKLRARWLAWERARSAPPSDCEPPEPEKPKTRLRRLTNRLKAKFRISPEEVAAVELAERILAERAEAHWEYPGVYGNLPDVLVEDCNTERMVPVYHENYGDDDEYMDGVNQRAELGAATSQPPTLKQKISEWGTYFPRNGVWDDPDQPLPGEDMVSHDDLQDALQETENKAPSLALNKFAGRGASRTIMQAKRVVRRWPAFRGGIDRFVPVNPPLRDFCPG